MREHDPDIANLFEPRSIAVIGASSDPKKIGHKILDNILSGGYRGRIYPVNPKGGQILGVPGFRDVQEIEILIPYSRLYLGVHYLGDVIGGFVFGAACFALIYPTARLAERHYHAVHTLILAGLLVLLPFMVSIFVPGKYINTNMGTISGFVIGALLAEERIRFNPRNGPAATVAKIAIGLSVVFAIRFGLKPLLPDVPSSGFFRYWLIGFWCSFGAPYAFGRVKALRGDVGSE